MHAWIKKTGVIIWPIQIKQNAAYVHFQKKNAAYVRPGENMRSYRKYLVYIKVLCLHLRLFGKLEELNLKAFIKFKSCQ